MKVPLSDRVALRISSHRLKMLLVTLSVMRLGVSENTISSPSDRSVSVKLMR